MWESVRYAALLPYRRPTRASLRSRRQVRRSQMLLSNPLLAKCPVMPMNESEYCAG